MSKEVIALPVFYNKKGILENLCNNDRTKYQLVLFIAIDYFGATTLGILTFNKTTPSVTV
jgi:hypothetical protein